MAQTMHTRDGIELQLLRDVFGLFNIDLSCGPETLVIKQRHVQYLDQYVQPSPGAKDWGCT